MATNVSVYDLENYPDNGKTVTTDQTTVVPTGAYGDEKWILSFSTNGYSDITNLTAIQDIYVQELKAGWAKSSGLTSIPYAVGASSRHLGVNIDNSSKIYYVAVAAASYGGDSLASALQTEIRALPTASGLQAWSSSDDSLAYKNVIVEYTDGKFYIVSGNVGAFYTGATRTSVIVTASGADTLYNIMGFNLGYDSQTIAGMSTPETTVASNYTSGTSPLSISADVGATAGDAMMITDGTNTDYFTVLSGSSTSLEVAVSATHTFDGITNSYTASTSKVQLLKEQDPDSEPKTYHSTVDSITRWGVMSVTNQLDFSA